MQLNVEGSRGQSCARVDCAIETQQSISCMILTLQLGWVFWPRLETLACDRSTGLLITKMVAFENNLGKSVEMGRGLALRWAWRILEKWRTPDNLLWVSFETD